MPCTISGVSIAVDSSSTVVAWTEEKFVYLQPSRDDFLFNRNASGTWVAWEGDPDLVDTYPGAIAVAVNQSTGAWSVTVPFSDTECQFVGAVGPGVPPLYWNIIDPNPTSGVKVYYGQTLSAIVTATNTLRGLLNLGSPNTWQIASTSFILYPYGTERIGSVTFAAGVGSAAVSFTDIGTSSWRFTHGIESTDTGSATFRIDPTTKTATGATCYLSTPPATATSTVVYLWVRA